MKRILYSLPFILCLLAMSVIKMSAQSLDHKQGELLVQLSPDQKIKSFLDEFHSSHFQAEILSVKPLVQSLNIWLFNFDFTKHNEGDIKSLLWRDQRVAQVQYNHFVNSRATPNDALFDLQWQHVNLLMNGSPDADLDSDLAWEISTGGLTPQGDTIVIAVIDNGINLDHPDLQGRTWINHREIPDNGIDDDMNGYVDDYLGYNTNEENDNVEGGIGHGTSVAGIIGAAGNNDLGVAGINWDSKLMVIRNNFNTTEANVIIAYGYAYTMRNNYNLSLGAEGAFVVATNASWGRDFGQAEDAPLWCSFYDELGEVGIINCAATANLPVNVDQDGDLPTACSSSYLVSVTNLNQFGEKVTDAGFGANSIDLGAFGEGVFTTFDNDYGAFGGTSAASPMVAGLIGLLYAAPCDNLTAIAKSNPKEAANFVVGYILDGTKPNASLQSVTKSGGQVNLFNSLTDMMNDCFECSLPSSISELEVGQGVGTFSWTAFNSSLAVNMQYRKVGDTIFNTVLNVVPPFTLTGLEPCTDYDFQLESICGDTTSNHTNIGQFSTTGCCENPSDIQVVAQDETEVQLFWEKAALVNEYAVRYKDVLDENWISLENTEGFVLIEGLSPCTDYEMQVKAICGQSDVLEYTPSFGFSTTGCGNCEEGNYCLVKGASTASEWIDQIIIGDTEIKSGNNDGYVLHDNFEIVLAEGGDYFFELNPGYANQALPETINVWVDLNQNSVFEAEEHLLSSPVVREEWQTRLKIPLGSTMGNTRMRVTLAWVENEDTPASILPCEEIAFGEVEDICIMIAPSQEACADRVGQIELLNSDLSSAILSWPKVDNANEYQILYRELGAPEFTSFYSTQNLVIINRLETCLRYEAQVAALCNGFATELNEVFLFDTECIPLSAEDAISGIDALVFPNPFTDFISIQLKESFEVRSVKLISLTGLEVNGYDIEFLEDRIQLNNLKHLSSGLYILSVEGKNGERAVFKVVKA